MGAVQQHRKYRKRMRYYFFLRACLDAYVHISIHVCYGGLCVKQLAQKIEVDTWASKQALNVLDGILRIGVVFVDKRRAWK